MDHVAGLCFPLAPAFRLLQPVLPLHHRVAILICHNIKFSPTVPTPGDSPPPEHSETGTGRVTETL